MHKETPRTRGKPAQAAAFVNRKITSLLTSHNDSLIRASLARLRRGIGKAPGSLSELWGDTLEGMPEALAGYGGNPSWGEWACYLALTLFALHQQGKDRKSNPMNREGQSLGRAVRKLVKNDDDQARIKRRFDQVVTADSPEELAHHLRSLIQLLKSDDVPLDYPALAMDLYRFQIPEERDGVRLRWGRDYYASTFVKDLQEELSEENDTTEGEEEDHEEE